MANEENREGSGDVRSVQREFFAAGAPGWYSLVALSFFFCEFNPIGAIGVAAGLKNVYANPLGWALTAASFILALTGFIIAERIAYAERQRRPLEISSIIAIAAGLIPFLVGTAIPAILMWPISAMFLVTGASGLRACRELPHPAETETGADGVREPAAPSPLIAETPPRTGRRHRRRRRRRSRKPGPGPSA